MMSAVLLLFSCAVLVKSAEGGKYVDYFPGSLNVILSAPHDGYLEPPNIPDRDAGCYVSGACVWRHDCGVKDETKCRATTVRDWFTLNLTLQLRLELYARLGKYPHVVINKLKRIKMDANRDKDEATFGNPTAIQAWMTYQTAINESVAQIQSVGPGLFLDIHAHGRKQQWAMLGYLVHGYQLNSGNFTSTQTSIRSLVARSGSKKLESILRGATSLGSYLEDAGFSAVPSPMNPGPRDAVYFRGGYNTRIHGSVTSGKVDAIQIESPTTFLSNYSHTYVKVLGAVIEKFLVMHYNKFPTAFHQNVNHISKTERKIKV